MKNTLTLKGDKAREAIGRGVRAIYKPVSATFGPQGKNALIYGKFNRGPRITNDGVTVAEVIDPKDPFIKLAAQAFKEMCKRTNEKAGDGTTGTSILGGKLYETVDRLLSENTTAFTSKGNQGVMTIRKQILAEAVKVKEAIRASATKIQTLEELERIATVSVEDPVLGKTIAQMAWEVGVDGFIDVVEGYKGEIETETINGMRFPAKVAAKAFVNNPARYEMVAQDCDVLLTNHAIDNAGEVAPLFQLLSSKTTKLIVLAPSFSDDVLINMTHAIKGGFFLYPVTVPALRTEQMEDLATYCGATFIDKNKGKKLKNVSHTDLGFLDKLIVKDTEAREDAVAMGGKGMQEVEGKSAIEDRIETLKAQITETKDQIFKTMLERRIASMASAVGVIRVGSSTNADTLYRKLKIEDAVFACRAALRSGYVKGGGLCLKEIAETLSDDSILKPALLAPYEQIQENAGGAIEITEDIIDPADAIYYAVEHATSVVANLITCDVIVAEEPEYSPVDGDFAIARSISEGTIALKRHLGLLKESEEEAERERMVEFDKALAEDK
jgi:chaperonin GroEL